MSLIALALTTALSGAVADTAAENEADIRCVAGIASVVMDAPDNVKPGLIGGAMFFFGRIEGRDPNYDFKGGMIRLANRPDYQTILIADRQRCAKIMEDRGQLMIDVGAALKAEGH